jgi:hypothetical protein
LLVVPSVLFAIYRLTVLPRFPATHALFGDWYNHALFATVFLIGFLLARIDTFWEAVERQRWIALGLAVVSYMSFLAVWSGKIGTPPSLWLKLYGGLAYGFYQWLGMVAVTGFARRWFIADSALRRYLTEAVFLFTSCIKPRSS